MPSLDQDGYPTEADLTKIREWPPTDPAGLMAFVKELWVYDLWDSEDDLGGHKRFYLSTAGWSGNESLIEAMTANIGFWAICWVSSRRGGHHVFEIPKGWGPTAQVQT